MNTLSSMKLAIMLIVAMNVLSLKVKDFKSSSQCPLYYSSYTDSTLSPVYYSDSPIYYTYFSSPYYHYFIDPSYVIPTKTVSTNYRKEDGTRKAKPSSDDLMKELRELKREIWGREEWSTEDIRESGKVYDARWLLAQLKITRVVELEDMLNIKYNQENEKQEEAIAARKEDGDEDETPKREVKETTKKDVKLRKHTADKEEKEDDEKEVIKEKKVEPTEKRNKKVTVIQDKPKETTKSDDTSK